MRALLSSVLCLSVLAWSSAVPVDARAQSKGSTDKATTSAAQTKRGFLWQVRKDDKRALLFGTVHVGKAEFYPLHADAMRRLNEVTAIALEVNVFEAQRVVPVVQRMAYFAEGEPELMQRLPEALRPRVQAAAQRVGFDAARIGRMKPWMLSNTLAVLEAMRSGYNPAYAAEAFLFQFAQASQKPIVELESIELQLGLFDGVPLEQQIAYLEQTVNAIENGNAEREIKRLVGAWEKGDAAEMEKLFNTMRQATNPADRFVVERIIEGRHPAMLDGIEKLIDSGKPHVIAVGTLHFFGPNGLIELLKARGYTVERL